MGLFNFNRANKNHNSSPEHSDSSAEQSHASYDQAASREAVQKAEQVKHNAKRQEDKLIRAFSQGAMAGFGPHEVSISQDEREDFYDKIADGQISRQEESAMLQQIGSPLDVGTTPQEVLDSMSHHHERKILAYMTELGFEQWEHVDGSDIEAMLNRYPTPVEFESAEKEFLEQMKEVNGIGKHDEYAKAMEDFKTKLYDKRYEYHKAFQSLQHKAIQHAKAQTARNNVLNTYRKGDQVYIPAVHSDDGPGNAQERITEKAHQSSADDLPITRGSDKQAQSERITKKTAQADTNDINRRITVKTSNEHVAESASSQAVEDNISKAERVSSKPVQVNRLSSAESQNLLKLGQIEGDTFISGNTERQLTVDKLEEMGLAPQYGIKFDNIEIGFSQTFPIDSSHDAAIAYVRSKDKDGNDQVKVCTYYRSNSQGVWRYLPDYTTQQEATGPVSDVAWFGKGHTEHSLNLPLETQYALDQINSQGSANISLADARFAFAGTAKRYKDFGEYWNRMYASRPEDGLQGHHYEQVNKHPSPEWMLGGDEHEGGPRMQPEDLDLRGGKAPDFTESQCSYVKDTGMYGRVQVEYFLSKDGKCRYAFNTDEKGRSWLGSAELVDSPLSDAGLRTEWAQLGDYGTPVYEYAEMAGRTADGTQLGDNGDVVYDGDGSPLYVGMWDSYLSKSPLIQKFMQFRKPFQAESPANLGQQVAPVQANAEPRAQRGGLRARLRGLFNR